MIPSWLTEQLIRVHPALGELSGFPLWVFLIVAVSTALFVVGYVVQGSRVWWQLRRAVWRIRRLKRRSSNVEPMAVGAILRSEPLKHLWEEYSDTLHELQRAQSGSNVVREVRATVPAEVYFTKETLVDSRMFDEFTRHLPGVLTGLGIIGTFAGLLEGLSQFDPSTTASAVAGLKPLLGGVSHAFIASAFAIGCAMGVIFISRLVLAYFYRLVERLAHLIDSLYSTGAGEEYLSRLVHASEKSEAHAAQLKEALVEDLTQLMTNLVERQMQTQAETTRALGERIGTSITSTLAGPLSRMTDAFEATSKGNNDAVAGMLEGMLTAFMAKLEDTFGGQMRGMNEQMNRSMSALAAVQQSLQGLVSDIAHTNEQAANQMSGKLEDAMRKASENQALMTEQLREFVQEFRTLVRDEQEQSKRAMDEAVSMSLKKVTEAVEQLELHRHAAAENEKSRTSELATQTSQLVGGLSGQVEALLKAIGVQVEKTERHIVALESVSLKAINGMNDGAASMTAAANRFETAGGSVSAVFERSESVSAQLSSTADVLNGAALTVRQGFENYEATRRTVDANIAVLTELLQQAKSEAGLSKRVLTDLERIVAELQQAEKQSLEYLEGVNGVLTTTFNSFGTAMTSKLSETLAAMDRALGSGVQQLNGVVQELGHALHKMKQVV